MPSLKRRRAHKTAPKRPRRKALAKRVRAALRWSLPAVAVAAVVGGGAWFFTGGRAGALLDAAHNGVITASAHAGLRIDNVLVTGRYRTAREDIYQVLGARRGMAILAFDPFTAKQRLEKLNWVRTATVERRLPDTIYLRLIEREPLALWQAGGKLALIDREGAVITRRHLGRYSRLPMVVGDDAATHAEAIIAILRARPVVAEATSAMIRVSGRRWDLKLKIGTVVHLPEDGVARAVATLASLIARDRILEREVIAIDLRLPDRLVVRTKPDARPQSDAGRGKDSKVRTARQPSRDT
ncbi:MAG: cell division protein FtsQ/DivIB [Alphaproteobacteria bacterium]